MIFLFSQVIFRSHVALRGISPKKGIFPKQILLWDFFGSPNVTTTTTIICQIMEFPYHPWKMEYIYLHA